MAENSGQERTEQATPKRLQEARDRGQVARRLHILRVDAKRRKVGLEGSIFAAQKMKHPAAGIMPPVIVIHGIDQAK